MLSLDDVRSAADRLAGIAHRTPVLTSRTLDDRVGGRVLVKAENLQRGGAFKFRGAYNAIATVAEDARSRGVAAFSSGNHAQAVAIAARTFGIQSVIVMPDDTPGVKLDATRGYGAEIVTYDRYAEDREELGRELAADRGMTLIPPYEHPAVMAGQGTVALELIEEAGDLDVLVVCIGGGGLMAGCATVARALLPGVRVVGVEPETANDTQRSLAAGERMRIDVPRTIADGLQADIPGELTFSVNSRLVDEIVTVSDDEIRSAMRFCAERMKVVVEPSGAVGIAALLAGAVEDVAGRTVGTVITGGNVDLMRFAELLGHQAPPTR